MTPLGAGEASAVLLHPVSCSLLRNEVQDRARKKRDVEYKRMC